MPLARGSSSRSDWYRYSGIGLQFALTIVAFCLIGWWLDGWLGTSPWLMIVLVFVGFFGAMVSMISRVSKLEASRKEKTPGHRGDEDSP